MKIEGNTLNVTSQHREGYGTVKCLQTPVQLFTQQLQLHSCSSYTHPSLAVPPRTGGKSLQLSGLLGKNGLLRPDSDGWKKTRRVGASAVAFFFIVVLLVVFPVALVLVVGPVLHLLLVLLQLQHRVEECVASITAPMPLSCLRTVFVNSFPLSHPLEAPSPDAFPVAEESQRSDRRRYTLTLPHLKKVQLR